MLTDLALRNLKRKPTRYKVADRDGMYVVVYPTGVVSFRYDYRLNGRRQALVIGRYHPQILTLALAREKCFEARKAVERNEWAAPGFVDTLFRAMMRNEVKRWDDEHFLGSSS